MNALFNKQAAVSLTLAAALALPQAISAKEMQDKAAPASSQERVADGHVTPLKSAAPAPDETTEAKTETAPANHNTVRSNRTSGGLAQDVDTGDTDQDGGTRATDYNSSRSNRSYAAPNDLDDNSDDSTGDTKATDYNSSRSNKSYAAPVDLDDNPSDEDATDYNSSRSNKADSSDAPD